MLKYAIDHSASDLHLASGSVPLMRVNGDLVPIPGELMLQEELLYKMLQELIPKKRQTNDELQEIDFAFSLPDLGRFRGNIFWQLNGISAAFRMIPFEVKTLVDLNVSAVLTKLCQLHSGLILVTGSTGMGKSTTLAAMVEEINQNKQSHIITIEDPIEFVYNNKRALIQQRELYQHTNTFHEALRAALREDPDVILIGELRDLETMRLALTAAETGHLVMATLHTASAAKTINRIIDVFPTHEKELMRMMLADSLQAVISQVLVKKKSAGRLVVQEIMLCNHAIRNLIRANEITQIYNIMQTNAALGMTTFVQVFNDLVNKGIIDNLERQDAWFNTIN
jgi:twitching motility protein PilT